MIFGFRPLEEMLWRYDVEYILIRLKPEAFRQNQNKILFKQKKWF